MKKIFFVLAAVITGARLEAQDSTGKFLDEAVITANKYPNKTSLTGKVVIVITREQLEKSGSKDLSQILTEQAGIYIGGANSNAGKDKSIYLRGASPDRSLITIDGIPVYDPSGIGGNFDIRNLAVNNIERVEILKGSQSTLYGSDAIAGVINIITRKASDKSLAGNIILSDGSFQTFRGAGGVNGKQGILDYNASYSYENTEGINETINKGNYPVVDRDKFRQSSFQVGFGIRPTEKIYLQPFFRYADIKGSIDQGAFTDELDYTYSQKSWQAGLRNEFNLGKGRLSLLYNYNTIDRVYTDDSTRSRNGFDTYSRGVYKGSEHFADAYLHWPLCQQLKLTAGLDYRNSHSDQRYFSTGAFGPYTSQYSRDSLHQDQLGLYAALNWNQRAGFNLEAGSRINFHSEYGSHFVFNVNPSYLIDRKVKIFVNVSSAFRTPSLYQLFSEYGNRDLKPESGLSFEGGLQYYAAGNKFTGRVVAFKRDVKDVIFFFYNAATYTSQYINQDKQKDHGFELEASYRFSKATLVKAFYTYVTGEITTKKAGKDTTYFNLLRRPKSSLGVQLSSQVTSRLFASTNLGYVGKRKDAYFDNSSFSTVNTTLKSYALWDIYAEYAVVKNRLRVFADLRNIMNSKYTEISGFNTPGFNGYGGIRFTFNK